MLEIDISMFNCHNIFFIYIRKIVKKSMNKSVNHCIFYSLFIENVK